MFAPVLAAGAVAALISSAALAQDQKLAAKGQELVVRNKCSTCHVVAGKGGKIAKPLDGVTSRLDEAALRRVLTNPEKELPPAKVKMPKVKWSEGDIDAVITYLQTLK